MGQEEIQQEIIRKQIISELKNYKDLFEKKIKSYLAREIVSISMSHVPSPRHRKFVEELLVKKDYQLYKDKRGEIIATSVLFHPPTNHKRTFHIAIVPCMRKKKRFWQREWHYVPVYFISYLYHKSEGFIYTSSSNFSEFLSMKDNKPIPMMIKALNEIYPHVIASVA
jgi:hypothetical protein